MANNGIHDLGIFFILFFSVAVRLKISGAVATLRSLPNALNFFFLLSDTI